MGRYRDSNEVVQIIQNYIEIDHKIERINRLIYDIGIYFNVLESSEEVCNHIIDLMEQKIKLLQKKENTVHLFDNQKPIFKTIFNSFVNDMEMPHTERMKKIGVRFRTYYRRLERLKKILKGE